jgi:SAM-dependent methyltransferase
MTDSLPLPEEAHAEPHDLAALAADYDRVADEYTRHIFGELAEKPFDRALLDRFARLTGDGLVCDGGCGPGHVSHYLHERGCDVFGIDISPRMVRLASELNPMIEFRVADLREPGIRPATLAGLVCLYSLIHFTAGELAAVLTTLRSTLRPGGQLLLAVHEGAETRTPGEMWGIPVSLKFNFFTQPQIEAALTQAGFAIDDILHREPYVGVEVETDRLYAMAIAPDDDNPERLAENQKEAPVAAASSASLRRTSRDWLPAFAEQGLRNRGVIEMSTTRGQGG